LKDIYLIWYNGTGWESEILFKSQYRTFDLDLADIDPAPGDEILFGSFKHEEDFALHYLYRDGDLWKERSIPTTEAVKAVTVADADPTVDGDEIWACIAGFNTQGGVESHLVEIYHDGTDWVEEIIYTQETELIANVKIGELWSQHDGNEIIVAELSGWCRVLYYEEGEFQMMDIFQADTISGQNSGLEGLAIGDFNPLHPGDEAMVTGYYNKVTQIVEVGGEVVDDLAWSKDVQDARLEISGVEVIDVSDEYEGNEVLVASLQGWIELLRYQDDGLSITGESNYIELEDGDETEFILWVDPEGRFTGRVNISVEHSDDLTVQYLNYVDIQFQESDYVEITINAEGLDRTRTSYVNITASGGDFTEEYSLMVEVMSIEGLDLTITPQVGRIYDKGVNMFNSKVSLSGGEKYDYIDLSASSVDGLSINVNTPLKPGEENDITISVNGEPDLGPHTISITGFYNGVTVAQGSLIVNVVSLEESFEASMRKVHGEDNRYLVYLNFTGLDPVPMTLIEVLHGEKSVYKATKDLAPSESISIPFTVQEGDEGMVKVDVRSLSGESVFNESLEEIEYDSGKEDPDLFGIFLVILVIVLAGIIIVLGLNWFVKPNRQESREADLQDIGAPSRYSPGKGPLGPERRRGPPERVRGGRLEREREPPRGREPKRAPPRHEDREPGPRDRGVRRARPAPDHLRPGGRQREVRRAPPRRY
jgi:hypothetical protein